MEQLQGEQLPLVDAGLDEATAVYQVCGALRPDDSWRPVPVPISEARISAFNALQQPPVPTALSQAIAAAEARLMKP